MLIESVATSVVVGKVRKGKIINIGDVDLKAWYLFILGFFVEFASVFIRLKDMFGLTDFLSNNFIFIHGLSYTIILIGLILNFNKKSMIIIFIGTLLNLTVIMANGGQMPVSGPGLSSLGLETELNMLKENSVLTHTLLTDSTKLKFLADVIKTPKFYPMAKMLSIGDIFLALGVFAFIQSAMINRNNGIKTIDIGYKTTR